MISSSPKHPANAHPYAIKTTSTGVLSRSNSTSSPSTQHYYIPPSPSPSPTRRQSQFSSGAGHRYSKSLSDEIPSPLPLPSDTHSPTRPTFSPAPTPSNSHFLDRPLSSPAPLIEDLHSNPKSWSPTQLSAYLATALRLRTHAGEDVPSLPAPVARDITKFIRDKRIGGKLFLRLNESDLEQMGINQLWRTALLSASRNLRQNVLRGRIWGFGSTADEDDDDGPESQAIRSTGRRLSLSPQKLECLSDNDTNKSKIPFASDLYASASSSSSLDLSSNSNTYKDGRGGYRNGRVKGMVASFERSSSFSEGDGEGDEVYGYWMKRKRTFSIDSANSEEEEGGANVGPSMSKSQLVAQMDPTPSAVLRPSPPERKEEEPSIEDLLVADDIKPRNNQGGTPYDGGHEDPFDTRQFSESREKIVDGDGPGRRGRDGYRAWEDIDGDDVGIVTYKRIEPGVRGSGGMGTGRRLRVKARSGVNAGDSEESMGSSEVGGMTGSKKIRGKGSKSWGLHGLKVKKEERRVVTAIFAGVDGDVAVEVPGEIPDEEDVGADADKNSGELEATRHHDVLVAFDKTIDPGAVPVDLGPPPVPDSQMAAVALEKEIGVTKSLLVAFKERLEEVERKVGEMEFREQEREARQFQQMSVSRPQSIFLRILRYIYPSSSTTAPRSDTTVRTTALQRIPDNVTLPGYIVLVGIGVCAVVLKVVLRRIARRPTS